MALVDRTAYPRLPRSVAARKLAEVFTPTGEEVSWARAKTTTDQYCLTLLVLLKCYQRLGYFLRPEQIPAEIAEHVRGCAELTSAGSVIDDDSPRLAKRYREFIRDFEVCVFAHLAAELRTGDIAVAGSESYANLHTQLMSWAECEPLVPGYCAQAGLPATAAECVARWREELETVATSVDAGYPDNADLVLEAGRPVLKRRTGAERRASALALEAAIHERLPERGLLDILTRTAYQIGWPHHFGPASGSDPKLGCP